MDEEPGEVDLVERNGRDYHHPIAPEDLRVFVELDDFPEDELNTSIDEIFVEQGRPTRPARRL